MLIDTQLKYLIIIYSIATILTFALDWQLPGFKQIASFSKNIDLDRYLIQDYMTYWQLTHFLTRFCLGFFCPKYWQIIFVIDFGWEALEWYQWNAHNWYDLIWNMLGLITGMMVRHYGLFDKYFTSLRKDKESNGAEQGNLTKTDNVEESVMAGSSEQGNLANTDIRHRSIHIPSDDGSKDRDDRDNKSMAVERSDDGGIEKQDVGGVDINAQIYFSGKKTGGVEINDGAQLLDNISKAHRKKKHGVDKKHGGDKKHK